LHGSVELLVFQEETSNSSKTMKTIAKRYDREARLYDLYEWLPEKLVFQKHRKRIFPELSGKILEVGVGTGNSLEYYTDKADVTGIDFSPKMLAQAQKKLNKLGKQNIKLMEGDIENLPFQDNTFDIVVTACVFCSVPNPIRGFKEVARVLKPNGKAVFLEHVKSNNWLIAFMQNLMNPLSVRIFGFNMNRDTRNNIEKGSLAVQKDKHLALGDIVRLFVCSK